MKNVLIPTDFSIKSLKLINAAVERFKNEQLNIVLVHALEPDNSISGLLMLNKRLRVHELYTAEFREACEVMRNKYASVIGKIVVEFYYGTTRQYRNNFIEGRSISAVLFPADYKLALPSSASVDMKSLFGKGDFPVYFEKILSTKKKVTVEEASLSELLIA